MGDEKAREFILTLSCPDTPGLVFSVSAYLVQQSCNILQNQQFDDRRGCWPAR